jgi:hypothetical protein
MLHRKGTKGPDARPTFIAAAYQKQKPTHASLARALPLLAYLLLHRAAARKPAAGLDQRRWNAAAPGVVPPQRVRMSWPPVVQWRVQRSTCTRRSAARAPDRTFAPPRFHRVTATYPPVAALSYTTPWDAISRKAAHNAGAPRMRASITRVVYVIAVINTMLHGEVGRRSRYERRGDSHYG